ncbi:MAG: hypothetical protein ACOWWH_01295, partial [Eubacteriaceae bacterium]
GLAQVSAHFTRIGTGTAGCNFLPLGILTSMSESLQNDISSKLSITKGNFALRLKGTVTTDLNCIQTLNISLANLQ